MSDFNANNFVMNSEFKQFKAIENMWINDLNKDKPSYPKVIKVGGIYTKKFLKYNELLIKQKKTFYYLGKDKIYNPKTGRFSELKKDKRYKAPQPIKKSDLKKKKPVFNTQFSTILKNTENSYEKDVKKMIIDLSNNPIDEDDKQKRITIDLKKIKFTRLIDIIKEIAPTANFITSTLGNEDTWITLSQNNLQRIVEFTDLTHQADGSDMEYLFNAIQSNGLIHLQTIEDKNNSKISGAFFTYYNKTAFDLSRYDIYKKEDEFDYKDNCLFIALQNGGLPTSELNKYKSFVKSGVVPLSKMNLICELLDIHIKLNRLINGTTKTLYYGCKTNPIHIHLGLLDDHYFLNEKTNITSYSLNCYDEVKHIEDFHKIYKKVGDKYKKSNERGISSYQVISKLLKEKHLIDKIPYEDLVKTPYYTSELKDSDNLVEITSDYYKENEITKTDNGDYYKVFYDFETCIEGEKHTPYLMCCLTQSGQKRSFIGKDCGKEFVNYLKKLKQPKILLIAHNQRYDISFIWSYIFCISILPKGNRLMGGGGRLYNYDKTFSEIKFQDSLNLINTSLKNFGKMFNLEQGKEVMPYSLYNIKNLKGKYVSLSKCLKCIELQDDKNKEIFKNNCSKWSCYEEKDNKQYVNIYEYSRRYCEIDCEVLMKGYETFRSWIYKIILRSGEPCELDIMNYCSAPSLVNDYMIKSGVYDDCYKIGGVPRAFIQNCVVGGKCMTANNKKNIIYKEVADYDGVSLYPSAMNELSGVLKGLPKLLKDDECNEEFLFKQDGFFIKVLCDNDCEIKLDFPLLSAKDDNGIRDFTNNTKGKVFYVDKTGYEDAKKFQGLKFTILSGYYYNEGRNYALKDTINILFNERLKKKKEKNPIQSIYKLFMNSAYGKSLLKPIDDETEIVFSKNWTKYLSKNYNFIKEFTKISETSYFVKKIKPINQHFNNCYFGVEVLSSAKRIMNRVMTTAQEIGANIYITDTDSLHIDYDRVVDLEAKYKEKYNKDLNGKLLGQFHIDFELKCDKTGEEAITNSIKSVRSVYLGKKCYIDELKGIGEETGNEIKGFHIRMKGIPNQAILYKCKEMNINPFDLYKKLYEGESIKFDLLCGGERINFKYDKFNVRSLGYFELDENGKKQDVKYDDKKYKDADLFSEFTRTIKF